MEPGSIAVVIPTFNRLELLRETLRSVEGQERPPTRIVVVDDGSCDGSAEWAEAETRASVLRNPEGGWGPARARAEGCRLADAEMVAFLDSDDLLLPNALAELGAALERAPTAPFAFGRALVARRDPDGWHATGLIAPTPRELRDPLPALFARNFVPSVGTLVRAAALARIGGYPADVTFAEDHYLWVRLAQLDDPAYVDALTAVYRVHGGGRHSPERAEAEAASFLDLIAGDPRLAPARAGRLGVGLTETAAPSFPRDPATLLRRLRAGLAGQPDKARILAAAARFWIDRRRRDAAGRRLWAEDPALRAWLAAY
ncbi:MAG TPA: glycosyltransferase [Solirubrobacterales bacterium]|nr:glycosyltransferase [Solirubrobacterales bacterium]